MLIKRSITSIIVLMFAVSALAQQPDVDSLAYQQQRKKINTMLAERKEKFGEYVQSLTMHSGIFGMQTKADIRNSNEILTDIVSTDDEILRQIKILLDYHTDQQNKVIVHTHEVEDKQLAYISLINKLRLQTAQLKLDLVDQQKENQNGKRIYIIVIVLMLASILVLLFRKRSVKV